MAGKYVSRKGSIYNKKRYWYHVSTTLSRKKIKLTPLDNDDQKIFNRADNEPNCKRICVAPSIEQCITAIPYDINDLLTIYRTKSPTLASPPVDIFDSEVTHEGWIQKVTTFVRVGTLDFVDMMKRKYPKDEHKQYVIKEEATSEDIQEQKRVLRWWRNAKIKDYIDYA
jgi:hypothetical protein